MPRLVDEWPGNPTLCFYRERIVVTIGAEEVIALFNRLANVVQSKIPLWLVMSEMTPEEVAVLERLLTRCEERSVSCEELWRESEEQRILCDLVKEVHRGR
jgi:hypothetical protein